MRQSERNIIEPFAVAPIPLSAGSVVNVTNFPSKAAVRKRLVKEQKDAEERAMAVERELESTREQHPVEDTETQTNVEKVERNNELDHEIRRLKEALEAKIVKLEEEIDGMEAASLQSSAPPPSIPTPPALSPNYVVLNPGYPQSHLYHYDHMLYREPRTDQSVESLREDIRDLKRSQDMLMKAQLDALSSKRLPASPIQVVEKGTNAAAATLAKCMEAFLERDRSLARERDELSRERQRLALDLERRTQEMLFAAKSAASAIDASSSAAAMEAERARKMKLDVEMERKARGGNVSTAKARRGARCRAEAT